MPNKPTFFRIAFVVIAITMLFRFYQLQYWEKREVISWDVTLYYSYLPALFIYDDIGFEHPPQELFDRQFGTSVSPTGNNIVKMSSGLAICYSPFFFVANWYASNSDTYAADGFSKPYKIALLASSLFFALIGLWFFGHWLHYFVSSGIATLVTIAIFIGTNLAYYTYVEPMSHVYGFALVSIILFFTFQYLDKQSLWKAILICAASGLLVLIRPTNIIVLLFPLLYLWFQKDHLNTRQLYAHLGLGLIAAIAAWAPQLLYWKHLSGQWIYYSYTEESFFFADPKIWKGLFSYRKGWFVYSPVLLFALAGFIAFYRKNKHLLLAALLTLVVGLWITFSWWCWWYGGSFGARALIEYLPIMGLGIAFFLKWAFQRSSLISIPAFVLVSALSLFTLFMTKQYTLGIVHYDSMSKELYWKEFLKDQYIHDYEQYLDPPDYAKALTNEQ